MVPTEYKRVGLDEYKRVGIWDAGATQQSR